MKFHVILLPEAERDIDGILGWLMNRSPRGAASWYQRWMRVLDDLETVAANCGLAPENERHELQIRQTIFKTRRGKPYRALFTIRDEAVFVLRVRGHGQDLVSPHDLQGPE